MAALLAHISDTLADPYGGRVQHGLDFIALGKLYKDLGHRDEAARLYERGIETGLTEADFGVAVKRLSILQKKRGDVDHALRLWEEPPPRVMSMPTSSWQNTTNTNCASEIRAQVDKGRTQTIEKVDMPAI